jgi:hypothetical protein
MTDHNKDMRQDRREDGLNNQSDARNRANQEAARRPGVDAEHGLDNRGHMVADPHEGSSFEPLRMGSDADRQREADSDYVLDQGAAQRSGDQHMTSRQRGPGQHGDAIRESQSAPGGGSVFQPLEADPRHLEDREAKQRGNPAGQNQQGLNEGSQARRDDGLPRGSAPGSSTPRRG